MGWPAVAGVALVGGAVLYQKLSGNGSTPTTETRHTTEISNNGLLVKSKEQEHISFVISEESDSPSLNFDFSAPISLKDLKDLKNLPRDIAMASTKNVGATTKDIIDSTKTTTKEIIASTKDMVTASKMMPPPPPSLQSQLRSKSPPRLKPPTFSAVPARTNGTPYQPPPSAAASLRVPQTKVLVNASMAPASLMAPPQKKSRTVALAPGHSPLDWAALTANPSSQLRGKDAPVDLAGITPSQLKIQNGRKGKDAWTVYHGKVYNITPYVPFHPGGDGQLLRGAGKDSTKLFEKVHPWVNWDGMLKECMVGILIAEEEQQQDNLLEELD